MSSTKTLFIASSFLLILLLDLCIFNTSELDNYTTITNVKSNDTILSGKQLSHIYCKICHQFPEPELLDKNTWTNNVLPNMGLRMGIKIPGINAFAGTPKEDLDLVKSLGIYPDKPIITKEQWGKIIEYYKNEAPNEPLEQKIKSQKINNLPLFKSEKVFINSKGFPRTSMLKFDESTNQLYVGDASNLIYILDNKMVVKKTWKMPSPAVDIDFPTNNSPRILTIGKFSPSDQKLGSLLYNNNMSIKNLPRPVDFTTGDLNMDKKEDIIICGFGHNTGKLLWYENFDAEKEHVLKDVPGARKVEIVDLNNDDKPDIVVLMAQAFEQVSVFYNKGNNVFEEKVVLKFPPTYGVSYFELVDFNKDGYKDILLTNGDNWDYSIIRKNYHGIRIYINDGHDHFENSFFYPLYGASKAIAKDFDNDGDIDIAASAFYSNEDNQEPFVYLSNDGDMNFSAYTTPEAANGKWLTMDAADLDNDGDIDIFLGSYFHTFGEYYKQVAKGVSSFPQLLVLTNNLE